MIESQVRALFTAIASSEPEASQVDTQLAHRRGRARLRWRRAASRAPRSSRPPLPWPWPSRWERPPRPGPAAR